MTRGQKTYKIRYHKYEYSKDSVSKILHRELEGLYKKRERERSALLSHVATALYCEHARFRLVYAPRDRTKHHLYEEDKIINNKLSPSLSKPLEQLNIAKTQHLKI